MKKILCTALALTLFLGAYFSLPKSISTFSGTDIFTVYAGEIRSYKSAKNMIFYYYTSSGSKKSYKISAGDTVIIRDKKYIVIRENGKTYKINVEKYIQNGTFY